MRVDAFLMYANSEKERERIGEIVDKENTVAAKRNFRLKCRSWPHMPSGSPERRRRDLG